MAAGVDRFGRIDVLVNNAGNFNAGFFEELSPEEFRAQIETTFFGPVNVTRAALPVMRAQRSGLVVTISSTAGLEGGEFASAYAASKFGVEGWMESLTPEVAPFGIRTMLVEPGFFRTELLTPESTRYAASSIEDYAERTEQTVTAWKGMNGQQGGDPAKLAGALVHLAAQEEPPLRFAAGADAVATFERRARTSLPRPTPTATCPAASPSIRARSRLASLRCAGSTRHPCLRLVMRSSSGWISRRLRSKLRRTSVTRPPYGKSDPRSIIDWSVSQRHRHRETLSRPVQEGRSASSESHFGLTHGVTRVPRQESVIEKSVNFQVAGVPPVSTISTP